MTSQLIGETQNNDGVVTPRSCCWVKIILLKVNKIYFLLNFFKGVSWGSLLCSLFSWQLLSWLLISPILLPCLHFSSCPSTVLGTGITASLIKAFRNGRTASIPGLRRRKNIDQIQWIIGSPRQQKLNLFLTSAFLHFLVFNNNHLLTQLCQLLNEGKCFCIAQVTKSEYNLTHQYTFYQQIWLQNVYVTVTTTSTLTTATTATTATTTRTTTT